MLLDASRVLREFPFTSRLQIIKDSHERIQARRAKMKQLRKQKAARLCVASSDVSDPTISDSDQDNASDGSDRGGASKDRRPPNPSNRKGAKKKSNKKDTNNFTKHIKLDKDGNVTLTGFADARLDVRRSAKYHYGMMVTHVLLLTCYTY